MSKLCIEVSDCGELVRFRCGSYVSEVEDTYHSTDPEVFEGIAKELGIEFDIVRDVSGMSEGE